MNLNPYKDIIRFAIEQEIASEKFYSDASDRLEDTFLKRLFREFADEERSHEEILNKIYQNNTIWIQFKEDRDFKVSETLDQPEVSDRMTPAQAFALAAKNEEAAMKQYEKLAESSRDPEMKNVFENLASMERGHKLRMENAFVDIGYPEVW